MAQALLGRKVSWEDWFTVFRTEEPVMRAREAALTGVPITLWSTLCLRYRTCAVSTLTMVDRLPCRLQTSKELLQ